MRLLLVDTNPVFAEQARSVLRDIPELEIDHVSDYNSATSCIKNNIYAVVLSDFCLETHNACDILRFLQKQSPDTPFILIAANISESDELDLLELGATEYVSKANMAKLPYVLKRAVKESHQVAQNRIMGLSMHDIMSPITAITGYLDLMKIQMNSDEKIGNTFKDYSQKIKSGVNDISSILEQMRATQKASTEQVEDEVLCLDVDLNWVANEVCDIMQGAASSRYHTLTYNPHVHPVYVSVDIPHIKRILYNFISNAIRYTPEGGRIDVEIGIQDGRAYMAVTDNGIGIPEDKHEQIFRMNAKLQKFDLYNKKSTGLGLYVNASLARQLGGSIEVESNPGEGSTFRLVLPSSGAMQQAG